MVRRRLNAIVAAVATLAAAACQDAAAPLPAPAAGGELHASAGMYEWVVSNVETIDLGTLPGGSYSAAFAINDAGVIVGEATSMFGYTVPVRWTAPGVITGVGTIGGLGGSAHGINKSGYITGEARSATGKYHAFEWSPISGMIDLYDYGNDPYGVHEPSIGRAINDYGTVAGDINTVATYWIAPLTTPHFVDFGYHNLGRAYDVNNFGVIVGKDATYSQAFIQRNGAVEYLPRLVLDQYSEDAAHAVSDSGVVVGFSRTHAARWTDATGVQDLGLLPGGSWSNAWDVNNAGVIVGSGDAVLRGDATERAFVWRPGMTAKAMLSPIGGLRIQQSHANAVNMSNWVVGTSETATGQTHATLWKVTMAYVPTPIASPPPIVLTP